MRLRATETATDDMTGIPGALCDVLLGECKLSQHSLCCSGGALGVTGKGVGKGCGSSDAEGSGEVGLPSGQSTLERIPRLCASACRLTAKAATAGDTGPKVWPPTTRSGWKTRRHHLAATEPLSLSARSLALSADAGVASLARSLGG